MAKRKHLEVRKHLTNYVRKFKNKSCVVMMSSGIDSHSVLFSCLEAGIRPTITSFTLEDRESRDFRSARHAAEVFDLPFRPIYLSTDLIRLKKYLLAVARKGAKGKAAFECLWPFIVTFRRVEEEVLFTGYATDPFFALTKKGSMHYKNNVSEYALEIWEKYSDPYSQLHILKRYANDLGFTYEVPWLAKGISDQFKSTIYTNEDLNRPKQKQPIRTQYAEELERCKVYNHTNAQLGDSGIAELFEQLLDDPFWNAKEYKSVTGIYNSIIRGDITTVEPKQQLGLM